MPRNKSIINNQGVCKQCKVTPVTRKKEFGTMPTCSTCLSINKKGRLSRQKIARKDGRRLGHYNKEGVRYGVVAAHNRYLREKLRRFGLTQEWYDTQPKVCGICSSITPRGKADWSFDHDHKCCKLGCPKCFRGILCRFCNTGIGFLNDDPIRLRKAADWVTKLEQSTSNESS
jgi:hypothetical protein